MRIRSALLTRRQMVASSIAASIVPLQVALAQEPSGAVQFGESKEDEVAVGLASSLVPTLDQRDPNATSLGDYAYIWHGDDLPRRVGGPPAGYVTKTYLTEWRRGTHGNGYMSFGPYFRPSGVGSLFQIRWLMSLSNRGGADADVLTVDCVDHNDRGRNLFSPTTFKVRDFPGNSDGFVIFSRRSVEIRPSMSIETRVYARGGANLALYQIRYDANYL